jgi:hypothetical protein
MVGARSCWLGRCWLKFLTSCSHTCAPKDTSHLIQLLHNSSQLLCESCRSCIQLFRLANPQLVRATAVFFHCSVLRQSNSFRMHCLNAVAVYTSYLSQLLFNSCLIVKTAAVVTSQLAQLLIKNCCLYCEANKQSCCSAAAFCCEGATVIQLIPVTLHSCLISCYLPFES